MKHVLIIDASPTFLEFLKDKLEEEKIEVTSIQGKRDAMTKIISILPDLVILDINEDNAFSAMLGFLQKVNADPNASRIPVIAVGPIYERSEIEIFAKLGLVKYFVKPIKFDIFFESIGHILRTAFSMDITPCVLDLHRNGNIIFIEIAQGLNREKIQLLKYKLGEITNAEKISPKIILMMSNLELTFVDGFNIEFLLDCILANSRIHAKNIKILSFSSFVKDLIDGHEDYSGIEVVTDISQVLNSVLDNSASSKVSDLITDNILATGEDDTEGSLEIRFSSDASAILPDETDMQEDSKKPKAAIVDDDAVISKLLSSAFEAAGFVCKQYSTGTEFLSQFSKSKYDIIILDIFMPGISGFDTLKRLQNVPSPPPVIVYSQAVDREMIIQILSFGAKQYIVKPQKPEVIVQKALEIINAVKQ